jgi:uncharacterized lipoprotein YmbA
MNERRDECIPPAWKGVRRAAHAARASCGVRTAALALGAMILAACAARPDHFYDLSAMPDTAPPPASAFATHVILSVSLPPLADRREMIVAAPGDRILVLEHERWAAPLGDLVTQTLALDLEQRRPDVLVANWSYDRAGAKPVRMQVDIVRMSAHRDGRAVLESHWRIVDPASQTDVLGGETFSAPIGGDDYSAIAGAFSACVASLADRLAGKLPSH